MDYTDFLVRNCPKSAMYIPNFITSEEEQRIIKQVENAPKPKWTQLSHRRLINYGGVPHANGMIAEVIPAWLQTYIDKVNNLGIFESRKANHVLVNEYLAGQGIMPHTDGSLFYPTISTISVGSHTILEFYKPECDKSQENSEETNATTRPVIPIPACEKYKRHLCCKLLLEPRSLLILKDSLYHDYLHSISEIKEDVICDHVYNLDGCATPYKYGDRLIRKTRISLTIRHVPKTTKMKLKFSM